jgi:hypothetical protein
VSSRGRDVNDLVDSLINTPRPASPYTISRQSGHAPPGPAVRAGTGTGSGSTPPGSIPGTPAAGRVSQMSNDGNTAPPRGHSSLGQALDL